MDTLSTNITTAGERNVTFKVQDLEDGQGYLSPENTDSEFGLVLIQEWWGLNKSITSTANAFAKLGLRVLAPDMYRGKVAKNREEAGHSFRDLNWSSATKDIKGAGEYLRSLGCKKVGVTGFCLGGALSLAAVATFPDTFDVAVPFYGIPDLNAYDVGKIKIPVLAHFGELDDAKGFSDPESAKKLESLAKEKGVDFTLHLWEGADHAFMNPDKQGHKPELYEAALKETFEFLMKVFKN